MGFVLGAGFVFCPTDKDLLKSFLKPKLNGQPLPCDLIVDKQIYGPLCNPWDVLDDSSIPWIISRDSKKIAYVFTPLDNQLRSSLINNSSGSSPANKSSRGVWRRKQYVRRAGCGTWIGQTARLPVMDNDRNVLGIKREFIFQINDVNAALRDDVDFNQIGHYRLHEYVLSGACQDYALCRITLDTSKPVKVVNRYRQDVSDITRSMQNLNCTHVLGKRKPFEAQDLCSGPSKMICM